MQINTINADLGFEKAERYLPIRLSTTYFDEIGECMCIVANRADGMTTDIIENKDSEVLAYRSKCRLKKTSCSSMGHFAG